ncbi:hypothetical protein GH733_013300 [Mirounga leonina]|nr:hypothetical protein GH733_013300 [Mirounga leonina]
MARNAEKAMKALARFRQAQLEEGKVKERRPFLASECTELPKAEKWRRQIIGEISKKVAQIQNAGLGEFRIRDMNDEINKLLREKGHWEVRIKELGGPDYGKVGPKMLDHEGKEVSGMRNTNRNSGLDGGKVESRARGPAGERRKGGGGRRGRDNIYAVTEEESDEEGSQEKGGEDWQQKFIAHVPVPSQQEIEEALVRRKKMELLQKNASEILQAQSEEAKRLLGY